MYLITQAWIDRLKTEGYDLWTISLYEKWLALVPQLTDILIRLEVAFADVRLNDGIGLRLADSIGMYGNTKDQHAASEADNKHSSGSWQNITAEELNEFDVAPSFFDAKGFLFHLPAFLLAELRDRHNQDFMFHFLCPPRQNDNWMLLLNEEQRDVLVDLIELLMLHPEAYDDTRQHEEQILRLKATCRNAG